VADGTKTGILIDIEYGQAHRNAQGRREGHAALLAFIRIVFRLFELILDVVDFRVEEKKEDSHDTDHQLP
ncbi:MAG: hypothetical protein LRY20_01655, partial [Acholeplasmataceae bacterium]|nr:hypothetical protein [Acholeplasmataceae bacterium]